MQADRTNSQVELGCIDVAVGPIRNMHDVFSNWCHRAILYYLQDHDDPVAVTAVTRQLIAWQRGTPVNAQRDAALVEQTRQQILQAHIPKMEEFGILGYDPDTDTVWIPDDVTLSVAPP